MSRLIMATLVFGLLILAGCPAEKYLQPGAIAVWQQDEGNTWNIRYSLWNDNTKAWYTPNGPATALIAAMDGDDHDPYVDSDGVDTAISVWSHEQDGSADIYYSVWNANTWSKPAPVSTMSGYDSDPAVAMNGDGEALAVWVNKGSGMLYYSTYNGREWTDAEPVDRAYAKSSLPELSYSPTVGIYFLIWTESTNAGVRVLSSGYSGSWVPVVEIPGQSENAAFDTNVPTDERIGLGTAGKKREAVAVWPTTNGELYASTWTPSGWSNAVMYGKEEMPDAEFEYGGVPYSVFINERDLHWSRDLYSANGVTAVPGSGEDYRPALTFIGDRVVGLSVYWTTATVPSEIYFTRWDGSAWEAVKIIDPAGVPGEDRNPDVSPLMKEDQEWDFYLDWCGDGVLQWPNMWGNFEQCEVGIPCPNPGDWCNPADCQCYYNYSNRTWCGDGIVQRPNSAGVMEECEIGVACLNPNEKCNLNTCKCEPQEGPPPEEPPEDGQPPPGEDGETPPEDGEGEEPDDGLAHCGDGHIGAGEECDVGGGLINGVQYGAARDTCPLSYSCWDDCKCHPGIVTPRCGDGYISGPEQGANEECDLGGRLGAPVLPDTCTPPEVCNYICRCEVPDVEDGMHYECVEGGCMLMDGEGLNECLYDWDCQHYECVDDSYCQLVLTPGDNECLIDEDCTVTHMECRDEECVEVYGEGQDECEWDDDCIEEEWHTECIEEQCVDVEGPGQWECLVDDDCVEDIIEYCGDGIVQEYLDEECEDDGDCYGEAVCNNCRCIDPPDLDCEFICAQTPGADFLAQGLSSSSACKSVLPDFYESITCYTTCRYSWFYRVDNVAGYDSCCCGMVKRFPCSDCPGQNPECPDPNDVCNANAPDWYSP